ncbi:MAG: calcium-binding protein, partial [Paracoccaceae bacterium]
MSGGQGNGGTGPVIPVDGVVTGTSGDDEMLPGYTDQNGDQIDGTDGLDDTILALDGGDTVDAGDGDDLVIGGSGADSLDGGDGNDTIFGDLGGGDGEYTIRDSLRWSEVADPDGADPIDDNDDLSGGFTHNTGNVGVTFKVLSQTPGSLTEFADNEQNVADTDANPNSSLFSDHDVSNGSSEYELTFDQGIENVQFRINDIDNDSSVTILAYNAEGEAVPITLDGGARLTISDSDGGNGDDTATSQGGNGLDTSEQYSVLVDIAGPITRIVIQHDQNGSTDSGVNVTDIHFDVDIEDTGEGAGDTIVGGDGDDVIYGEDGDDTITGGDGADTLIGGDDEDLFVGGTAGDVVDGGDTGSDFDTLDLRGQGDVSIVYTDEDKEDGYVFLDEFGEYVEFHDIEEILVDGNRDPDGIVEGTFDPDVIDDQYDGDPDGDFVDAEDNIFPGGDPNSDIIVAKSGDDTIVAGEDRDLIFAGDGDDNVDGGAGDDTACGGDGDDYLDGADGDDVMFGKAGFDTVIGGDGADFLSGGLDNDEVVGGAGNDTLEGNEGIDLVDGGSGNDLIDGGEGDDFLDAGGGDDTVFGGDGNDNITGNPGDDSLLGGDGDDTIQANDGDDYVSGGAGNDFISTGPGEDTVEAGDDRDTILVVGQNNQFIDGNEGGDDFDTLIVRGFAEDVKDPTNPENGTIFYLDEFGVRTGITTTYINIEDVIIDPNPDIDGVVEGDDTANLIDANYTGDPEGDVIDGFDALENFLDAPADATVPSEFFEFLGGPPRGGKRFPVGAGGRDDTGLTGEGCAIWLGGDGDERLGCGV